MDRIGTIELEGMEFKAYHGCLDQEKVRGNAFTVDFRGQLDLSKASESDNLNDTVNYGEIYEIVAEEMSIPSELLENVVSAGYEVELCYNHPSAFNPCGMVIGWGNNAADSIDLAFAATMGELCKGE